MAINPYHEWLGLDPKIPTPHYFQLLGVSSKVDDANQYAGQVRAAADAKLELLDHVDAGENAELLEQLKQRIRRARDVLSEPSQRQAYIKKLKASINAAKGAARAASKSATNQPGRSTDSGTKPDSVGEPPPPGAAPSNPDLIPPAKISPVPPVTTPPSVGKPPEHTATPVTSVSPDTPAPPIPMAVPLQPSASPPIPVQDVAIGPDGVPVGEIKITKVKRKRKKSAAGRVLVVLMLLAAVAGIVAVVLNFDSLMKLSGIDVEAVPPAPGILKQEGSTEGPPRIPVDDKSDDAGSADQPRDLPTVDLDSLPELDIDEVMEHPDTLKATRRDAEMERKRADVIENRLKSHGNDDPFGLNNVTELDPQPKMETDACGEAELTRPTKTLDLNQLAELRRRLQRARRSLVRRDKSTALSEVQKSEQLLQDLLGYEFAIVADQQHLQQLVAATAEATELLDGFWLQVLSSSKSIPGGQEIRVGERIVGFVEANDQRVIIRNEGANVTWAYDYLPPGLAVALAEQGAIPDIPTWRLQLVAFYSLYINQDPAYATKIVSLMSASELDGHDVSLGRRFSQERLDGVGTPATKINMPDKDSLHESLAEFRSQQDYTSPTNVDPATAETLALELLDRSPATTDQRIAFLEEAHELGIRAQNTFIVADAIAELDYWVKFDLPDRYVESLLEMSRQKLESSQARKLMETAIPFLKSPASESVDPRKKQMLVSRLAKLAAIHQFVDASRRLSQIQ